MEHLTLRDFNDGRLNLESFVNLEKGVITKEDFKTFYKGHTIIDQKQMCKLVNDVKSELLEEPETKREDIAKAINEEFRNFEKVKVINKDTEQVEVFFCVKKQLEKGQIADAFTYNSDLKIDKKGSEIREHLSKICSKIDEKKNALKIRCAMLIEKIGFAPTEEVGEWQYQGCKTKLEQRFRYHWNKCNWEEDMGMSRSGLRSSSIIGEHTPSESKEMSKLCCDYNEAVDKLIKCEVDCCFIETLLGNIKDGSNYELTTEQIVALGF